MAVPFDATNKNLDAMKIKLDAANASAAALTASLQDVANATVNVDTVLKKAQQTQEDFNNGWGSIYNSIFDIQTMINDGYKQAADAAGGTAKTDAAYAAKLQTLADKITAVMGPNNPFATDISTEIAMLKSGTLTPQEAYSVLQGVLGAFAPGMMAEIADPNLSAGLKEVDQEILRFLSSGATQ